MFVETGKVSQPIDGLSVKSWQVAEKLIVP
jgi:hypothetical protein